MSKRIPVSGIAYFLPIDLMVVVDQPPRLSTATRAPTLSQGRSVVMVISFLASITFIGGTIIGFYDLCIGAFFGCLYGSFSLGFSHQTIGHRCGGLWSQG